MSSDSKLGEFVYCKKEDSLRLMRKPEHSKERTCTRCNTNEKELIPVSIEDMSELIKYFGKNNLIRMINMINHWPLEGSFAYKNPVYLYLPEHKNLEKLFIEWNNLSEIDQIDEVMDLRNYQRKRKEILVQESEFLKYIRKELSDLEKGL